MISYNELFEKKKKEKVVVFTFGRFQPPTAGHQVLIDKVSSIASRVGGDAVVFPSPAESGKSNPLSHKDKVSFMKKTFRKVTVINDKTIINPFYALKKFSDAGYTKVILVVGSDRVSEFKKTVTPYLFHKDPKLALNFEFEVMSAGERDPDATGVAGVSGTKVRQFASDDDYDSFKGSMPSGASDREVKKIFNALRKSMGIKESTISFSELEKGDKLKPTIVVLTKQVDDNLSGTAAKMEKSCKKYGIPFYPILTDQAYVTDEDSTKSTVTIHNYDGENRKVKLDLSSVIVFVRGSAITTHGGLGLVQIFEQAGSFVINSAEAMKFCQNKLATALSFERNGIPSPRTSFVNNESSIDIAHEKVGGKFPVIVKTLTGAEGIGVSKVDSYESLKSVLQSLWKFDAEVIIQEFMDIEYDVRTLVLNGAIVASAKRMKGSKDFRTNKSLGNKTKPHKLSDKEKEFVINVSKMSGCYFCGVDHILVNGKIYALEVNGSPGVGMNEYQGYYEGSKNTTKGQELVNHIVNYVVDKENWSFTSRDVGYVEYVEIAGEKMKAKLDTGNGSVNAIHAENVKVKGKNVTFDLFGKYNMTKPYHDAVNIHVGAGEIRDRKVVKLDMKINGITYKDVDFSLADRKENVYPVLLGKKFLQALNYSVNVNKKFSLKEEPKILDRLVQQLMAKGMGKKQAFATATSQLQKNGVLKNGSQELTQKGKKRNSMSAGERAKDRAAKKDGKKPSEYSYNKKTNIATLSDDANYSFEDIIEKDRDYKKEYAKYHSKPEQRANRSKRVLARRQLEKDGRVCKGDGKDVDHKDGNPQNNSDGNLRVMSANKNRGRDNNKWRKD
jgi:RimK family alpha-L-glutamate ligase